MNKWVVGVVAAFAVLVVLFAKMDLASAQSLPGLKDNEAIVVYGLQTDDEKLRYKIIWAPYDKVTQTYFDKKGKKKKIKTFDGKTFSKQQRGNKTVKKYFYEVIKPGTYVLHTIKGPGSLTSYHPETIGFEVNSGDVIFLGNFLVFQGNEVFRSIIDPMTGVSLQLLDADVNSLNLTAVEIKSTGYPRLLEFLSSEEPIYFKIRDYD